jgi:class 3 adenylate cyclase
MTAARRCPSCGTGLLADARFCHGCGCAVAARENPAEFKQVTVLFADVVGSMSIAAAVGAERLREIMTELVNRTTSVVERYGGSVDKFTGDGIMAVFGAPVTLEDHAVRACLAALQIQGEAERLAAEVSPRDAVTLRLRIGLNSGQVIAGEIGSGALGYTTIGEQVGLAQRMESAAPPGGVMISDSTSRLVATTAILGDPELVRIKGQDAPVPARRLLAVEPHRDLVGATEPSLFGRRWEMSAVEGVLERTRDGRGGIVSVVGPPGIGKSRMAREAAALADAVGMDVCWTFCDSHAADVPFYALTRLMRAASQVSGLDAVTARARLRAQFTDTDEDDLQLLDDLLGIADPTAQLPQIAADARRRRLITLIKAATLASFAPALYIVEDVHWIDEVSESMLADFFTVVPQTATMVLITYRPEYQGALARTPAAQSIALVPLGDSELKALVEELLGHDRSVQKLGATIRSRVGGNPFFAAEIVRDLDERGVLVGERGSYVCHTDLAEVTVPANLQATIGARIDRLDRKAKRALCAAAVIGSRFDTDLLTELGVEPTVDELISAELVDQVRYTPQAEFAFRHPLIRTVAYESQLKADRVDAHRRVADAIQRRDPESADENAALIAEHLEAADEVQLAYDWQMRAAAWSTSRDITAARVGWKRACQLADRLLDDVAQDTQRTAKRIAPRAMLCASAWQGIQEPISGYFAELRELCEAAGDNASLAVGMYGLAAEHMFHGQVREAAQVATQQMALLKSIGDQTMTIGVAFLSIGVMLETGDADGVLRLAQTVIDWADGDPLKGNVMMGSPLAAATLWRGIGRWALGRPGGHHDVEAALAMARTAGPAAYATMAALKYAGLLPGVLVADDNAVRELEEALEIAEGLSDDTALGSTRLSLGVTLTYRDDAAERRRGVELLEQDREMCRQGRWFKSELTTIDMMVARARAADGDLDGAIPMIRAVVSEMTKSGQLGFGVNAYAIYGELLLQRGTDDDLAEAEAVIDQLAQLPLSAELAFRNVALLRLRALLARARADDGAYRDLVGRYRDMAKKLGFQRHIDMAREL